MDTDGCIPIQRTFFEATAMQVSNSATRASFMDVLPLIILFVVLVILGGYFGGTESAISAMNRIRMKAKADDGNKSAKNAMYLSSNFDKALTALLIGNNITHIAAASVATLIATRLFGSSDTVTVLCTVFTTLIVFLFSEMIPKSFANDRCDSIAMAFSGSLKLLMKILTPLTWFFGKISDLATKFSDKVFKHKEEPSVTEEELYDIIDTIEEEGVMTEEQADLFESALDFSEIKAKDVMTMRRDISALDIAYPIETVLSIVRNTPHTRLPVFEGNIDNVIGILQIRTFLRAYLQNPQVDLRSILLPAFYVSPDAKIDDLLSQMKEHRFYLGVVSDANGKTLGLVSIEDFLEELVGEIYDEDDIVDKNFISLGGNRYQVKLNLPMGEVFRRMGQPLPDKIPPHMSVRMFVKGVFNNMPEEDDSALYGNIELYADDTVSNDYPFIILHPMTQEEVAEYKASHQEKEESEADK